MFYHKTTNAHRKNKDKNIKNTKVSVKYVETVCGYSKEKLKEL